MSQRSATERAYDGAVRVFAGLIVIFGAVIVIRTLVAGGGPLSFGLAIGVAFMVLGAGRFYLAMRR